MKKALFLAFTSLFLSCSQHQDDVYNGNFEQLNSKHQPSGWVDHEGSKQSASYIVELDNKVVKNGKYSLTIRKKTGEDSYAVSTCIIEQTFKGSNIELRGYIKTQNVRNGFAGLWLRIDGADRAIGLNNMQQDSLHGTLNWKEYKISLPYDENLAKKVTFGGLLSGSGQMWMDGLRLYIDGKPAPVNKSSVVSELTTKKEVKGIDSLQLSKQQVTNLALFCQAWGLLKYHHMGFSSGKYDVDTELINILPQVTKARNNKELSHIIEGWVDSYKVPPSCVNCMLKYDGTIKRMPDYGRLFETNILSASLQNKLRFIIANRNTGYNYYVSFGESSFAKFIHEDTYNQMQYPDINYRLVSLFRYWNIIQYYYPYKHLIGQSWTAVLERFIPQFVKCANAEQYGLTTLSLIANIHDSHANIWSTHAAIENYRGRYYLPFHAKLIEDRLVVTAIPNTHKNYSPVAVGDVVTKIDGQPIPSLVKKYLPITPGSNINSQLRDLPKYYLLRNQKEQVELRVMKNKAVKTVKVNNLKGDFTESKQPSYYKMLPGDIGYLYCGKYKNDDLPTLQNYFSGAKGLIVDMRCYPSDFMPFTFVRYIKRTNNSFVNFENADRTYPGLFRESRTRLAMVPRSFLTL
jgi:hypothetical protein